MLSTVTLQQRRAAHALTQHSWWLPLRELIESELVAIHTLMTDATNPVLLHQYQGRAQALRDLNSFFVNAGRVLEKMNDSRVASGNQR